MGLILSTTERQQFVDALKLARAIGWSDGKIAKELRVPNGDIKNMSMGLIMPSAKHVHRLNELLRSTPPKRLTPPPLDGSYPPIENAAAATKVLFVGDDGGAKRPRKEETTVEKQKVTNGVSHSTEANEAATNARYLLLSQGESKILRRAMNKAYTTLYKGSTAKMAEKLGMTNSGLRKVLRNPSGSISRRTREQFISLTGWDPEAKSEGRPKPAAKVHTSTTRSRLGRAETKQFRKAIMSEVEREGISVAELAEKMGVNRGTLVLVLSGRGSTQETRGRFDDYLRLKGGPPKRSTTSVVTRLHPAPKRAASAIEAPLDLYGIAARMTAAGRIEEGLFLCVVARAYRLVPIEVLTETLAALAPIASTG